MAKPYSKFDSEQKPALAMLCSVASGVVTMAPNLTAKQPLHWDSVVPVEAATGALESVEIVVVSVDPLWSAVD